MNVIGFVGPIAGGKSFAAQLLRDRGFMYFSLSDEVRIEAASRGLVTERTILQDVGNDLREKFGNDVLAVRVAQRIGESQVDNVVIDGIRHPGEVAHIRAYLGGRIIAVTADANTRWERLRLRNRSSDPKIRAEFDRADSRVLGVGEESHGQQVSACIALADVVIENTDGKEALQEKLLEALASFIVEGGAETIEYSGRPIEQE
ncbi:MAG: AAA family ATPase [bacterium]|nr:AAA family ATPase [bacterium]